jgi:hypothetical protein
MQMEASQSRVADEGGSHMGNNSRDVRPIPDPTTLTTNQLNAAILALKELVVTRLDGMDKAMSLFNENITRVPTDTDKQIQHLKELHDTKIKSLEETVVSGFATTDRERVLIREVMRSELDALDRAHGTRLEGMDKAVSLLQVILNRGPEETQMRIDTLQTLLQEKLDGVQTQFKERDVRVEQTARDTKVAVDAALQAAEKAVGKQNEASSLSIAKSESATNKLMDQLASNISSSSAALSDKIDDMKQRLTRLEGQDLGQKTAVTTQQTSNMGTVSIISLVVAVVIGLGGLLVGFLHISPPAPTVVYQPPPGNGAAK